MSHRPNGKTRSVSKFADRVAELVYLLSLDGGADEEVGSSTESPGTWAGLMRGGAQMAQALEADPKGYDLDADDATDLTEIRRSAGIILFEETSGSVTADVYEDGDALEEAWTAVVRDLEPEAADDEERSYGRNGKRPEHLSRRELGELMLHWHSSGSDPIYAVGSFYNAGQTYPDPEVVVEARDALRKLLSQDERMLRGEKVIVKRQQGGGPYRGGPMVDVDLAKFSGVKPKELKENIAELREILFNLNDLIEHDDYGHMPNTSRLTMKTNTTLDHTPSAEEWFKRYPDLGREPLFTIRFKVGHPAQSVTVRAYEGPVQQPYGHTRLFCELKAPGVVFPRGDFYVGLPSGTVIDGDDAKEAVLSLFAMKPGDTDSEFFQDYTPAQLEFVESYGEDIYMIKLDRYGER